MKKDDWKKVVKDENKKLKKIIENISLSGYDNDDYINNLKLQIEANNLRLEKNIPYGSDYKNQNLEIYIIKKGVLSEYNGKDISKLSKAEKESYYEEREMYLIAEYSLEHDLDIQGFNSSYSIFHNFFIAIQSKPCYNFMVCATKLLHQFRIFRRRNH